jgi:hypothetical protein
MADLETLLADTRYWLDQGSDPAAPPAGEPVTYTKSGLLYIRNSSGVVGPLLVEAAHDAHDHTGVPGVGTGGSGIAAGTSFPGSPSGGDLFFRTDRGLLYFYDNTNSRWLTVNEYTLPWVTRVAISNTGISATSSVAHSATTGSDGNMWLTAFRIQCYVQTSAADASNRWEVALNTRNAANTTTTQTSVNVNSQTANTNKEWVGAAGFEIDCSTEIQFVLQATKTGSPGALYLGTDIRYRRVG